MATDDNDTISQYLIKDPFRRMSLGMLFEWGRRRRNRWWWSCWALEIFLSFVSTLCFLFIMCKFIRLGRRYHWYFNCLLFARPAHYPNCGYIDCNWPTPLPPNRYYLAERESTKCLMADKAFIPGPVVGLLPSPTIPHRFAPQAIRSHSKSMHHIAVRKRL